MAFNMPTSGDGWRIAGAIEQLGNEVAAAHPDFTCLGTIGNAAHVAEGMASDHNPFIKDPVTGIGIVRAIDIGGPDIELKALRQYLWTRYAAQDARVYEFGYMKGCSDNLINGWGLPFSTHVDDGDAGHLHVSVTQVNGNSPSPSGYVAAIDSRASWGIASVITPPAPAPAPASAMGPWPSIIPTNQYFGLITGPAASHGGYYADERPYVEQIQTQLNTIGCGPIAVDGQFGPATAAAVTKFQHAYMPGTKFYGQVWTDDWAKLRSL